MGGVNSYAKKDVIYSTGFDDKNGGKCTWESGIKKYSWEESGNNTIRMFSFEAGKLSTISKIRVKWTGLTEGASIRILIPHPDGGNYQATSSVTDGDIELDLREDFTHQWGWGKPTAEVLARVTSIRIGGNSAPTEEQIAEGITEHSMTINPSDIYLESYEYEAMDITTTVNTTSTVSTPFQWHKTDLNTDRTDDIENNLGKTTSGTIFGYGTDNSKANGFFDLTGYDKVTVTLAAFDGDKATQVRLLNGDGDHLVFNCSSGTLTYTSETMPTSCTSIKANWSEAGTSQNVSSVVFNKSFNAASATAFSIAASTSSTISYDRSFTGDQASTVCLPFALTKSECDAAGVFYELTDYDGSTLTFTEVTSGTTAYKPYLFVAKSTATPFNALTARAITASSGATTSYTTTENNGYSATITGTLAHKLLDDGVYGWDSINGEFSVTDGTSVAIDAFRAYITVSGVSSARLATLFVDSSLTGINEVSNSEDVKSVKNFEGKVFENGKIIIFKKGMKFSVNGQLIK